MPPACAMAIARCDSVTVSIAALEIGMLSGMLRVNLVAVSASVGRTSLRAGTRETSSKVKASVMSPASIVLPQGGCAPGARVEFIITGVSRGDAQHIVAGLSGPAMECIKANVAF